MKRATFAAVICCFALICAAAAAGGGHETQEEAFHEEAVVTPLPDGLVLVHLHFTQQAPARRHHTLFPRAVGQLAAATPFESVQLSLTQGRWHYDKWGAPLLEANPAGAVLRAHFSPQLPPDNLPGLWGNLSHALGGLFCASLNFVARPEATAPLTISMQPAQGLQQQAEGGTRWVPCASSDRVLYAALPQEAACTENLTPWLKLLPCRDAAGLGRLLTQRGVVFGADYHSLQVHIHVQRDSQQRPTATTLRQSFTLVLRAPEPASTTSSSSRQPPKPGVLSDVALSALLGSEAPSACPVASTSRLLLQLPPLPQQQEQQQDDAAWAPELLLQQLPAYTSVAATQNATEAQQQQLSGTASRAPKWSTQWFDLSPAPDAVAVLGGGGSSSCSSRVFVVYDLHLNPPPLLQPSSQQADAASDADAASTALPFRVTWQQPAASVPHEPLSKPRFAVSRFITGVGQLHGGMVLELTAPAAAATALDEFASSDSDSSDSSSSSDMSVCILQVVPWYIRLWLHTLQLSIDGQHVPLQQTMLPSYVSPARDRKQPLVLDLCLAVPRSAVSITLTAQFTKAFLHMLEHPPDAHRGFDVPPAVVTVGDVPPSQPAAQHAAATGSATSSGSSSSWRVVAAQGAPSAEQLQLVTPLMAQLMQEQPPLVYSPGLVVPLAVPDFSMPYNVICLTSTVLAIFMGGVLNALLWRPGKEARDAADPKVAAQRRRKKMVRLVVLVVAFAGLALQYDSDLQEEIVKQARALGLLQEAAGSDEL